MKNYKKENNRILFNFLLYNITFILTFLLVFDNKLFIINANNLNDDTSKIQKFIDTQAALGGGLVVIPKGVYLIDAEKSIVLKDNIELKFEDGVILKALPNSNEHYQILRIHNVNNVKIIGPAIIVGERFEHTGKTGEWGFGISIRGSSNITIEKLTIKDNWGDGIYVGSSAPQYFSENVIIRDVRISNNRRQGISLISGQNVEIKNAVISNTNGTLPQCGIDIEPNFAKEILKDIKIINLETNNNQGCGLLMHLKNIQTVPISIYVDRKDKISEKVIISAISHLRGSINVGGYYYLSDKEIVEKPSANILYDRTTLIKGKADPSVMIKATVDGKIVGNSQTDKIGDFSIPILKQIAGKNLVLVAEDQYGNLSKETIVTVKKFIGEKPKRVAGQNRYETAVEISRKSWGTANTVILATGEDFPDSLTGGPLAFKEKAPILLTRSNVLTKVTEDEISRLKAKKIILVGGKMAISEDIEAVLRRKGLTVERIGGENRYATAALIAERLNSNSAVIGYGQNFPDVLAVSPYAAKHGIPILLTRKDRLPSETKKALNGKTKTIVVGSTDVVEKKVMSELPNPVRFGGATRYETAKIVITKLPLGVQQGYVATGLNFPDALAGGPLAAKNNSPIFLVEKQKVPAVYEDILKNYLGFTILGSSGVVGNEVANALYQSLID